MVTKKKKPLTKRRSVKGALIKGMSKKLPRVLLSSPTFRRKMKELMTGYAGIYALYKDTKLYYVGLAGNLFNRLSGHQKNRHKGNWDTFVIFRIKRVRLLKDIETLVTHIAELPGNRVKGRVPQDADINKVLKEILREHEKEIQGIKKALRK